MVAFSTHFVTRAPTHFYVFIDFKLCFTTLSPPRLTCLICVYLTAQSHSLSMVNFPFLSKGKLTFSPPQHTAHKAYDHCMTTLFKASFESSHATSYTV
ncbi:hypothetical protein HanIR_Chr16g0836531 [Helianthus annuus]|nr:hypothetical protein HanIR_Chr16g0836531 [Helianthus annuus]